MNNVLKNYLKVKIKLKEKYKNFLILFLKQLKKNLNLMHLLDLILNILQR